MIWYLGRSDDVTDWSECGRQGTSSTGITWSADVGKWWDDSID